METQTSNPASDVGSCPVCGVEIAVAGLYAHAEVRCAGCGARFNLDSTDRDLPARNRKATASVVLGAISFIGLFFTGIPAVILGWRALKDIKLRKTRGGRRRAIAGIVTGSVFGLSCGCLAVSALLVLPGIKPTSDPVAIREVQAVIGSFEVPEGIEPHQVQRAPFGLLHLRFRDPGAATTVMSVYYPSTSAANESTARAQAVSLRFDLPELKLVRHHTFVNRGRSLQVSEERPIRDRESRVYSGFLEHTDGWVAVIIITEAGQRGNTADDRPESEPKKKRITMSLEDVKRFFESYEPPPRKP